MPSLRIIYASTSGHTEYVVDCLIEFLKKKSRGLKIAKIRVEEAMERDLKKGDVLLLASSTWNTGGNEGQLNPHMDEFCAKRAKDADLRGCTVAVIGLGDKRYRYTCKAADRLEDFVKERGGRLVCKSMRMIDEPWGQEEKIERWGEKLLAALTSSKFPAFVRPRRTTTGRQVPSSKK